MCVGDSGNNESSLDIVHDQFSNTQLDPAQKGGYPLQRSNSGAHQQDTATRTKYFAPARAAHNLVHFATARDYLASSFLPASRLSKFRIALNTMK